MGDTGRTDHVGAGRNGKRLAAAGGVCALGLVLIFLLQYVPSWLHETSETPPACTQEQIELAVKAHVPSLSFYMGAILQNWGFPLTLSSWKVTRIRWRLMMR